MSCRENPSSKSIKFQPMPMAALIANLTLPPTIVNLDSDSSDESNSSFDKPPVCSKKPHNSKTVPADPKSRVEIPLAENRSAVKSLDVKNDRTPSQVGNVSNKENINFGKTYRLPRGYVLPTIEGLASTSQQVTVEGLLAAPKRALVPDKKESVRCLFPEPTKEPSPSKGPPTLKEPPTPKETPTPKEIPSYHPVTNPPANTPLDASHSQPTRLRTLSIAATPSEPQGRSVAATPSQPQGPKTGSKIHFKTITIKGKKYMIVKKLGMGGSSEVFKVLEINSSQEYAVKCVDLATDRDMAQGYMNEVQLLRDLQKSDRVIKLYEYEYDRANSFLRLLMEVGETDLSCILRVHRDGAPPALVLHYWEEMLHAVRQIHEHGIVHADLKPANFLLVSGRLKLIDFGIASAVSNDATSVVRSCGKGTFSYISPEALGGDGGQPFKVSFYSDVWSLGCILYGLIYGYTPFAHLATMLKILTIKDPNHRIAYQPADNIPPSLITALKRCLRYDAHSRPTVTELLEIKYLDFNPKGSLDTVLDKVRPHITSQELDILQRRVPDTLLEKLRPHVTPQELVILQGKIPDSLLDKLRPHVTPQEVVVLLND